MDQENSVPSGDSGSVGGGYKVRRAGSAGFNISKPKRNRRKLRQMRLKNGRRAR